MMGTQAELEAMDPIGQDGVNVTSAGLSAQYEKMWRVTFSGSTVEGDVETLQVTSTLIVALHLVTPFGLFFALLPNITLVHRLPQYPEQYIRDDKVLHCDILRFWACHCTE